MEAEERLRSTAGCQHESLSLDEGDFFFSGSILKLEFELSLF